MNQGGFGGGQPPGGYPPGGQGGYPQGGGYPAPGGYGPAPGAGQPGGYQQPPQQGYPQQGQGYAAQPQQPGGWGQAPQGQPPPQQGGWGQAPQGQQQPPPQQGGWGQPQQGYGAPPGGGYGAAPQGGFGAPPGMGMGAAPGAGEAARFSFDGTGGELFGKLFVGFLLTGITFGIYAPWFAVNFINYICEKTTISTPNGPMRPRFNGTGGQLFGAMFVGYLLTMITFGIYGSWFMCKMARYFADNTQVQASDGRVYQLQFTGEGGELFGKAIVNGLLTAITLYIYLPWAICNMRKWFYQKTQIVEQGQPIGQLDFVGEGGALFGNFLVGVLLTVVTVGIYGSWFKVAMQKFYDQNTRILVRGRTYTLDFTGTGGDLFVLSLVNGILTVVTLGIYTFWAQVKMIKWNYENSVVRG